MGFIIIIELARKTIPSYNIPRSLVNFVIYNHVKLSHHPQKKKKKTTRQPKLTYQEKEKREEINSDSQPDRRSNRYSWTEW